MKTRVGDVRKSAISLPAEKNSGRAGEHDAADRVALIGLAQRSAHVGVHCTRKGVFLLRGIHPDDADGAIIRHGDSTSHRLPPVLPRYY